MYQARRILQIKNILVPHQVREHLLNYQIYDSFNNLTLPNSPSLSFKISPNRTFFKCTKSPQLTWQADEYFNRSYSYKGCPEFSVYYTYPSMPGLIPPPYCSILLMPQIGVEPNSNPNYSDPFAVLTYEFYLQLRVSDKCCMCKLEGGLCLIDRNDEF